MKAVIKITGIIFLAFILLSLIVYRFRLNGATAPPHQNNSVKIEMNTTEGDIITVDSEAGTFVLEDSDQTVTLDFDDTTRITEMGERVSPSALTAGERALVNYTDRSGRNWASSISLTPSEP